VIGRYCGKYISPGLQLAFTTISSRLPVTGLALNTTAATSARIKVC
jgi:hypothetical protein